MSSQLNNSQKIYVEKRVQKRMHKKFMQLTAKGKGCDVLELAAQLRAFYQKVRRHWARKNKLDYEATWNYYQAVYACQYIDRMFPIAPSAEDIDKELAKDSVETNLWGTTGKSARLVKRD
jgi:hypothetical protein